MTTAINDRDLSDEISDYLEWTLKTGIWDGRPISWNEASEFWKEVQLRILAHLFEPQEPCALPANLVFTSHPSLSSYDIQRLDVSDSAMEVGLGKSLKKFWKNHKKELLIGAAVLAVATVVAVVAASALTAGAATAGGAALSASSKKEKKQGPPVQNLTVQNNTSFLQETKIPPAPSLSLDPSTTDKKLIFGEKGLLVNGEYSSYSDVLKNPLHTSLPVHPVGHSSLIPNESSISTITPPPFNPKLPPLIPNLENPPTLNPLVRPKLPISKESSSKNSDAQIEPSFQNPKPWISNFMETIGRGIVDNPDLYDPNTSLPIHEISTRFSTLGERYSHLGFAGTNGMNTNSKQAADHANYLQRLAQNHSIDWVHNCSHGPIIDLLEIFTINYAGYSPNTSDLSLEIWEAFHEENADRPFAKFLQFCHSQGAIHIRNALLKAPKEIRDRVIVVAIAPGAIVPDDLCFKSYNYASKNDLVPYGELVFEGAIDPSEVGVSKRMEAIIELRKELVLLDPHPDAVGMDHDFQSPTFKEKISDHLNEYILQNGEYR